MEKLKPVVIKDEFGNEKYVLEFNREAVRKAEASGFAIAKAEDKLFTTMEDLFFFAFYKNHPKMTRQEVDNVREEIGGISDALFTRLADLYAETINSLIANEESQKNAKLTVCL